MRTKMAFPIRFWGTLLLILLLYQFSTDADANGYKFEKIVQQEFHLSADWGAATRSPVKHSALGLVFILDGAHNTDRPD